MRAARPGILNVGLYPNRTRGDVGCTADFSRKGTVLAHDVRVISGPGAGNPGVLIRPVVLLEQAY